MTPEDLLAFEEDIAAEFEQAKIAAPVHLAGGNEQQLLDVFAQFDPTCDWAACQWRSHYHCLLAGVPPEEVKAAIMAGRSIALCFPHYRVISSAIVGGICPIALGIAWALKHQDRPGKVWCFIGDMTASTGIFTECMRYAMGHDLPIQFVLEDNGMSVCTPTREVWGQHMTQKFGGYAYKLTRPHVGIQKWVSF